MIIKIERSGGFLGKSTSTEIDGNKLPSTLMSKAKKIMMDDSLHSLPKKATPKGAADHYYYRILIKDGLNSKMIECNELDIQDELKQLVKFIEKIQKGKIE